VSQYPRINLDQSPQSGPANESHQPKDWGIFSRHGRQLTDSPRQEILEDLLYTTDPKLTGKLAAELSRALAEQDPTILERMKPGP